MILSFKNNGLNYLFLYLFLNYFIQVFIHVFFEDEVSLAYDISDTSTLYVMLYIAVFMFIFLLFKKMFKKIKKIKISKQIVFALGIITNILIFIYLLSSVNFFYNYNISFRHSVRLRDAGLLVQIMFFLAFFSKYVIVVFLSKAVNGFELSINEKILVISIFISAFLSINSSMTIIFLLVCTFLLVRPSIFTKKISTSTYFSLGVLLVFVGVGVVFFGHANKIGIEAALEKFGNTNEAMDTFTHLMTRISTSYFSLNILLTNHLMDISLQMDVMLGVFHTFLQKLSVITPYSFNVTSDIVSVNNVNAELLFMKDIRDITGASPGLLASSVYIPLIGLLVICFYTLTIVNSINRYFRHKLNLFGLFALYTLIVAVFESPINMFVLIYPPFLFYFLFVAGSIFVPNYKGVNNV